MNTSSGYSNLSRVDPPVTVDSDTPAPSRSLPMNPSHMIFHVINSTENSFAFVVHAWNTWLVLDAAAGQ